MDKTQRIIKKAVEELGKENPDLSYLRGMLESLVEDEMRVPTFILPAVSPTFIAPADPNVPQDEASILDAKARAAMASIKEMSINE